MPCQVLTHRLLTFFVWSGLKIGFQGFESTAGVDPPVVQSYQILGGRGGRQGAHGHTSSRRWGLKTARCEKDSMTAGAGAESAQ